MRGRFFSWLSSDDRCHPERLEQLVAALERAPNAGMAHTAYRLINDSGVPTGVTVPDDLPGTEAFYRLLKGNVVNGSTVLVRKELLDEVGPLLETHHEYPDLLRVSEYILWLELSARADVELLTAPLHDYRIHLLNSEYNGSSLGQTLVRIAKRYFLKKYGLSRVVTWLCSRSKADRTDVYSRLISILSADPYSEDAGIFLEALTHEGSAEAAAVERVCRELQHRENAKEILRFYLESHGDPTRAVIETFTEPSAELETLTLKLLNRAKAHYQERRVQDAARRLRDLLPVSRFFPPLDLSARFYLGLSFDELGEEDLAFEQFEAVLNLDPSHQKAAAWIEQRGRTTSLLISPV